MADTARPNRIDRAAIEERRRKVSRLYLARRTMRQIAAELAVSPFTVCQDIKALLSEWHKENQADIGAVVSRELEELADLERRAQDEFDQSADPQWAAVRLKCKDRRARLLGLDKPVKAEVSGPDGGPIEFHDIRETLDGKISRLADAARAAGDPGRAD